MLFNEYTIKLSSTGEVFDIFEIFTTEGIDTSKIEAILKYCPRVSKELLEEAKLGYSGRFQLLLKSPPKGALIKLNQTCRLTHHCAMADPKRCNTSQFVLNKLRLPQCYEYGNVVDLQNKDYPLRTKEEALASSIVRAWADGKIVILTVDD